jgi:hypothetical protein
MYAFLRDEVQDYLMRKIFDSHKQIFEDKRESGIWRNF